MYFCEPCRDRKNWPDSATVASERCEVCGTQSHCYDVPSIMLIPESSRTFDQRLLFKVVMEGFRDKAEALSIMSLDGKTDHLRTTMLQQIFVHRRNELDWYATYQTRLRVIEGHREFERAKRDRR